MEIAEIVKKHRAEQRLTVRQFGQALGVTGQSVYLWEHGTRPDTEYLVGLAKSHADWRRNFAVEVLGAKGIVLAAAQPAE